MLKPTYQKKKNRTFGMKVPKQLARQSQTRFGNKI
jgi:hypothetical protein